jgi:hypothetical protein
LRALAAKCKQNRDIWPPSGRPTVLCDAALA